MTKPLSLTRKSVAYRLSYDRMYISEIIWVLNHYRYTAAQAAKIISKVGRLNMNCLLYAIPISRYPVHVDFVEIIPLHTMKPFQQKDAIIQMNLRHTGSRAKQPLMLFKESYSTVLSIDIYK